MQAFEEQLVTVIVSNDLASPPLLALTQLIYAQSINLIENHDFRDLLLLLRESLQDGDIPHRTKLRSLILDAGLKYYDNLKQELKGSIGKIAFTLDIWSSKVMLASPCSRDDYPETEQVRFSAVIPTTHSSSSPYNASAGGTQVPQCSASTGFFRSNSIIAGELLDGRRRDE
ncbi:hypothetical protein B0H13DRAFT_2327990 [Mycena leptocephala]|nr:hypothetical protein B0H13DRAFT_2327990 [Mycena leptocephala]